MKCSLAFCFGYDPLCSFAAHGVTEYASKQQKEVTTVEPKNQNIHRLHTKKLNTCIRTIQCHANTVRFGN